MARVLHVINGLRLGGAETALARLLTGSDRRLFRHRVVALAERGPLAEPLAAAGIEVDALDVAGSWPGPRAVIGLYRIARRFRPDLAVGWMYHGNLAAWAASRAAPGRVPVVWNVRQTLPQDLSGVKRSTMAIVRLGARLAPGVAAVVYNSEASAARHVALGYPGARIEVVANGFDCQRFRPRAGAAAALRRRFGTAGDTLLIGRVGRYHPFKDYPGFLRAAARLAPEPAVELVLAGPGVDAANRALAASIAEAGLEGRVHLLGPVDDMPALLAGLDLVCSSSRGEGFPNVVGEAMACGVPCVVTDVGASADLVGDTGVAVPAGDPEALARGLAELLALSPASRAERGRAARARIERRFTTERTLERHEKIWRAALAGG